MSTAAQSGLHTDLPTPAREALIHAMGAGSACARACILCASACLREEDVAGMRDCILRDLDCADLCEITAKMLARYRRGEVEVGRGSLEACITACSACSRECARHAAHHEHCRACAEASRLCQDACRDLVAQLR